MPVSRTMQMQWRIEATRAASFCEHKPVKQERVRVRSSKLLCRPGCLERGRMRVYVISDLHTDHEANMEWVKKLASDMYLQDALIVAGDVSEDMQTFGETMRMLKERFKHVFFVPGNHDLWCRKQQMDSLAKLVALNELCKGIGVETEPKKVNDSVWIVPLLSWYHQSFDTEKEIESHSFPPPEKKCIDYRACKWPSTMDSLADDLAIYFDGLNNNGYLEEIQSSDCAAVITFSHFLPRVELCPEKRMLFYPKLLKIVGSDWLEARLRKIHQATRHGLTCHVFGHTHFCWDAILDGVRYIQAPLAYPRERERRMNGGEEWLPLCVYDSKTGLIDGPLPCPWSEHYRTHQRDPDNVELAPWVIAHLTSPAQ